MMRPFFTVGTILLALFSSGLAAAGDDAYSDSSDSTRPTESDDEEDNLDEPSGSLESGGLKAPDALPETGDERSEIEKDLDQADQKDAGRGLEFAYVSGEVGFQALGLSTFKDGAMVPDGDDGSGVGVTYGGGLGFRLLYFSLGGRFRNAALNDLKHWSLLLEGALRVPLGAFEPHVVLGGGYAKVSHAGDMENASGFNLRLGGGLDFYPSDSFSVGAQVGGDMLFLSNSDGKNIGGGATATGLIGLHF